MSIRFSSLPLSASLGALILLSGCSLKINSDLDGKDDIPYSDCSYDAQCTGTNEACIEMTDGISTWDQCDCAHGYERAGEACTSWVGLVTDPGFTDATAWTLSGEASIDETGSGDDGPGILEITQIGLCDLAVASQTLPNTSTLAGSGPLVVEITSRLGPGSSMHPHIPTGYQVKMGVGIDGNWATFYAPDDWATTRICLGEATLGGSVDLNVGTMAQLEGSVGFTCEGGHFNMDWDVEISRVDILPANADECPEVGVVANPYFELDGDWTETLQQGNGTSMIVDGAGKDGSRGMVLAVPAGSGQVATTTPFLFPADRTNAQALSFWNLGTAGQSMEVRAGGHLLATVQGDGIGHDVTVCIPDYLNGVGQDITFGNRPGSSWPSPTSFAIDEVSVHADARCADSIGVVNGGFDLISAPTEYHPQVPDYVSGAISAVVIEDAMNARSGEGTFRFESTNQGSSLCDTCFGHQRFFVAGPTRDSGGGGALSFWYLADALPNYRLKTTLDGSTDWLDEGPTWSRHVVCLPNRAEGRPIPFRYTYEPQVTVNQPIPAETAFVDDAMGVYDASCAL